MFKREMGGVERIVWKCGYHSHNALMTIRIDGSFGEDEMREALRKVTRRHPLLRVRIAVDGANVAWFTSEGVPEPCLRVVHKADDDAWTDHASEELTHYFPWDEGPLVRFVLVKSPGTNHLLINALHPVFDGTSGVYLTRDLIRCLDCPEEVVECFKEVPSLDSVLPDDQTRKLLPKGVAGILNRKAWKRVEPNRDPGIRKVNERCIVQAWRLSERQTSRLIARTNEEGVSVHSTLCAAFQLAQRDVQGCSPAFRNKLKMPANLRNMLSRDLGEVVGLYAYQDMISVAIDAGTDFWVAARKIQEKARSRLTRNRLLRHFLYLRGLNPSAVDTLGLLIERTKKITTGLAVTNIGAVKHPMQGDLAEVTGMYPIGNILASEKTLGVATVGGRICFILLHRPSVIDQETVEKVRGSAMGYLARVAGWNQKATQE